MNKVALRLFLFVAVFLGLFSILREVDWMRIFNVNENKESLERELGDIYLEFIQATEDIITDNVVYEPVDSIFNTICLANEIDRERFKLHIIDDPMVNAFALPDQHIIIYTGLILEADNPNELAGVLSHELAHIELNHIMKKLVKEFGLSVLISMTTGSNSGEVLTESLKALSSTAFDRQLEQEADLQAVDYMISANINPEGLADFMYKLSIDEADFISYLNWLSTHPASEDRAQYILEYIQSYDNESHEVLSDSIWYQLQKDIKVRQ